VDYTQPPVPVEERFKQVLAGRDLAGSFQLIALPVVAATAAVVVVALDALFRLFGAPLVLKADNGGQFLCYTVRELLDRWGVTLLPSPPLTPRYNGSMEAGIGSLKTHAHHRAIQHGRESVWTADDLEAAWTPTSTAALGASRGIHRNINGTPARRSLRRGAPSSFTPLSRGPSRPELTWVCPGPVPWTTEHKPLLAVPRSAEHLNRSVIFWSRGGELVHHLISKKCRQFSRGHRNHPG
jgi:hypothetical protein